MSEPEKRPPEDLITSLIGGIQSVVHSVQSLASSGATQVRQTVFPSGTGLNGVFGFTVKADLGRPSITFEPIGGSAQGIAGHALVSEYIEPPTEFSENEAAFVIALEIPGVGLGDVSLAFENRALTITAENTRRKYRKKLVLPAACSTEVVSRTCQDGVLELRLAKQ